jgi:hypothetical protein
MLKKLGKISDGDIKKSGNQIVKKIREVPFMYGKVTNNGGKKIENKGTMHPFLP